MPDRAIFEPAYAGKAPWDVGKPQAPFVSVFSAGGPRPWFAIVRGNE